jgi:hypothetical protein
MLTRLAVEGIRKVAAWMCNIAEISNVVSTSDKRNRWVDTTEKLTCDSNIIGDCYSGENM